MLDDGAAEQDAVAAIRRDTCEFAQSLWLLWPQS